MLKLFKQYKYLVFCSLLDITGRSLLTELFTRSDDISRRLSSFQRRLSRSRCCEQGQWCGRRLHSLVVQSLTAAGTGKTGLPGIFGDNCYSST